MKTSMDELTLFKREKERKKKNQFRSIYGGICTDGALTVSADIRCNVQYEKKQRLIRSSPYNKWGALGDLHTSFYSGAVKGFSRIVSASK